MSTLSKAFLKSTKSIWCEGSLFMRLLARHTCSRVLCPAVKPAWQAWRVPASCFSRRVFSSRAVGFQTQVSKARGR